MKKILLYLLVFAVISPSLHSATIAINGVYGFNAVSSTGANLANNSLALVVVDTGSNNFSNFSINTGDNYSVGSTFNSAEYKVVGQFGATNTTNANLDTLLSGNVSFDTTTLGVSTGQKFALVWFDGATLGGASTASSGQFYQFGRGADWILPSAPSTKTMGTDFTQLGNSTGSSAGQTTFAIAAAPEPNRTLLGMIGLCVLFIRRRR